MQRVQGNSLAKHAIPYRLLNLNKSRRGISHFFFSATLI